MQGHTCVMQCHRVLLPQVAGTYTVYAWYNPCDWQARWGAHAHREAGVRARKRGKQLALRPLRQPQRDDEAREPPARPLDTPEATHDQAVRVPLVRRLVALPLQARAA